jgi:hypothetical protein
MLITWYIALPASVYYLGYCLVCQWVLPGIFPCLPVGVTWDTALSASVYYLGYSFVCQCLPPKISLVSQCVTWSLHCLPVVLLRKLSCLLTCVTWDCLVC